MEDGGAISIYSAEGRASPLLPLKLLLGWRTGGRGGGAKEARRRGGGNGGPRAIFIVSVSSQV